jgi:amino acid adenylation domain-containing protein
MVPSAFVWLDELPRTPNQKVDRKALPAPEFERVADHLFTAPVNEVERTLAKIWSDVIGVDSVGTTDNFLDMGGHSLLAMQIVARAQLAFEVEVSVGDLFLCPTIREMGELIERRREEGADFAVTAIELRERPERLPLSFSQERVWFLEQLLPGNTAYNAYVTIRFDGTLDIDALQRSLDEIVRRHEILRTSFKAIDGRPAQQIEEPETVDMPIIDLSDLPETQRRAQVDEWVQRECQRSFDITRTPLVRWTLLREGPESHTLIQVEHHFVHDGWTMSVLLREIKALYAAFCAGRPSPLEALPLQFADFAIWQRQWMESATAERQEAYWTERLAGSPPLLELPADRTRPKLPSFRGGQCKLELPPALCESLRTLARDEQCSLFTTMQAAFNVLLARYTGQDDIVTATGVANRPLRETENMLGMVLNNVVLRSDLSGDPSFRELLARVRESTLHAFSNQHLPFEKIVDAVRPDRSLSYNPLYQVMFAFHDSPMPTLEFPDLTGTIQYPHNGSAKFDLNVIVEPRAERRIGPGEVPGERMIVDFEYSDDLFERSTIQRMMEQYGALLAAIVADPGAAISEFEIISSAERELILGEWNATRAEYPRDACIHGLVEARAAESPEAVALVSGDSQASYADLNRRANRLAHLLIARGVAPDDRVGVCLTRGPQTVVTLLAILKAGGAYLPLDASLPRERLDLMISDASASIVITQRDLSDGRLPQIGERVYLDEDAEEIGRQAEHNPALRLSAENLAYVLYTSGSTGRPKGVAVPHRAVVRLLVNNPFVDLDASKTLLHLAPTSFDASTFEIWGALLHGGKCVVHAERVPGPEELGAALSKYDVTTLWLTSSLFNAVIDEKPEALAGVSQLLIGGEALSVPHVRRALDCLPNTRIVNGYGPTESTTFACCQPIERPLPAGLHSIPIGRPIANTRAYVVDTRLRLVPMGVPGELLIGGDGLARGYVNDADATAQKFVADPFGPDEGSRAYRTGDRVRQRADGSIEFLGRLDDQIKLRGFRIELGEVEWALRQSTDVKDAAVRLLGTGDEPKMLVGYVVGDAAAEPNEAELRASLGERLPAYMVPSAFVVLDAFPLTPSGKVDRKRLPLPSANRAHSHLEPETETQRRVAEIWRSLLGVERIGVHDNFFDLGGNSLLATQSLSRLRSVFGPELSLSALFDDPTVGGVAERIDAICTTPAANTDEPIRPIRRVERRTGRNE